ncbi:hypothetical protein KKF17_03570 [Patescibacteria group bacterium]|nr:hypothetical protein [Patescibacteria group bacterium]
MASEIKLKDIAVANFTITLAGLANGSARASVSIDNSTTDYPMAMVHLKITSGAVAPTAGALYEVYLLRYNGTIGTDGWVGTDTAIVIENAPMLGTIVVTATAAKAFYGEFDTTAIGILGATWGIAVKNSSGQAISATETDHIKTYKSYVPEIQ